MMKIESFFIVINMQNFHSLSLLQLCSFCIFTTCKYQNTGKNNKDGKCKKQNEPVHFVGYLIKLSLLMIMVNSDISGARNRIFGHTRKMGFLGEWIKVFSSFCAKFLAYLTGVFQNWMCSIITVKASNMQQKFAKNEEKPCSTCL